MQKKLYLCTNKKNEHEKYDGIVADLITFGYRVWADDSSELQVAVACVAAAGMANTLT